MSLINDALNKVQKERGKQQAAERLARAGPAVGNSATKTGRLPPYMWVTINAAVLIIVLAANHFFTRGSSSDAVNTTNLAPAPVAAASERTAPEPFIPRPKTNPAPYKTPVKISDAPVSPAESPFVRSAPAPVESSSSDVEYDLAGMTVVGKNTLLSIVRRSDQRSIWVPVGKTVGEVTAVSYNPDLDNAVIRVRGQLVTIGMRNGAVIFNPVPAGQR
ncbi:MAG: hypothetical protein ABIZ04_26815 [Opitutus sp.]